METKCGVRRRKCRSGEVEVVEAVEAVEVVEAEWYEISFGF